MTRIRSGGKVFRDPIHQLIRIGSEDEFVLDLIDTPEFQRLRRIRQLGVSWLTYHGAEHSRFVHSLGVFNFARRIIDALKQRYGPKDKVSKALHEHAKAIKAAALLHDLGHGPFSHMLERAFQKKKHHEDLTIQFITTKTSRIHGVLKAHGIEPESVASIIRKDFPLKFVVDIVSSQLDADRMDYLLRDSYCTGAAYGEYDANWLIHAMCVGNLKNDTSLKHRKLCLDSSKGIHAAERFVIARLHMYQQVYMHRVTRGFEVLVLNLFNAAAHCAGQGALPRATPPVVARYFEAKGDISLDEFLQFDEAQVVTAFHAWANDGAPACTTIRRLSRAFLDRHRLYAAVDLDGSPQTMLKLGPLLEHLPKESDNATPLYGIDTVEDTPYKGMLYRAGQHRDAEEIVNESILIADPLSSDSAQPVESRSRLLKEMDAQGFNLTRLYYDRERVAEFRPIAKELGVTLPRQEADQ